MHRRKYFFPLCYNMLWKKSSSNYFISDCYLNRGFEFLVRANCPWKYQEFVFWRIFEDDECFSTRERIIKGKYKYFYTPSEKLQVCDIGPPWFLKINYSTELRSTKKIINFFLIHWNGDGVAKAWTFPIWWLLIYVLQKKKILRRNILWIVILFSKILSWKFWFLRGTNFLGLIAWKTISNIFIFGISKSTTNRMSWTWNNS